MAAGIYTSATELAQAIRARKMSAREVVQAHLDRIDAVNPLINAVVQLVPERALSEADAADAALARGDAVGPLHGVPITLKDSIDTEGIITTWGTMGRKDFIPDHDAPVAARLRDAGAIVLGKTNTPEFTMDGETVNEIYGQTVNPHDLTRSPSGSSGGAGAIIAAGGSPLDIGSDTGGSIRGPAHFCGICGIKPTTGRVPRTGHAIPDGIGAQNGLSQLGPLARCVEDLVLALSIISGPDGSDTTVVGMPAPDPSSVDVASLRVAWYTDGGLHPADDDVTRAVRDAVAALADQGATMTEAAPPDLDSVARLTETLRLTAGFQWVHDYLAANNFPPAGERVQGFIGAPTTDNTHQAGLQDVLVEIDGFRANALRFMEDFDVIICPPDTTPALLLNAMPEPEVRDSVWSHAYYANLLEWPAAVVPARMTDDSLPVGVQIIGAPWREDIVLAVAQTLENTLEGCRRPNLKLE